jgi:molybdopterin/thiamine biosynthesis adenylyltransferase
MSGPEPKPWYANGERLAQELGALTERGYAPSEERIEDGLVRVSARVRHCDERVEVEITFAAEHPFITPTVTSSTGVLNRHQRPRSENFCLDREDAPWWRPENTAADLLDHLQSLLDADADGSLREREADMPEPISGQLAYHDDAVVVVPATLLGAVLDEDGGMLQLVRSRRNPQLLAVHARLTGRNADPLMSAAELRGLVLAGGVDRYRVRWRSVTVPEGRVGVERAIAELAETLRPLIEGARARPQWKVQRRTVWAAVTFMQEGPRRGERERAWVFARQVVPVRDRSGQRQPALLRTQALSPGVRRLRTRELQGLERARFLVVGAGSLGGHVALELARAGAGALDIVDHDYYDLNNGVRHVLPASYAGRAKAEAVAQLARACSPFTEAHGHMLNVGSSPSAKQRLLELIDAADVAVDATGSENITRLLHWRCAEAAVPLTSGALTTGGLAGRIVILRRPSPCLDCFYEDPSIPPRESMRAASTTPYGCSHPAASCAPFEAAELSANLARCAVRCVPRLAYPPLDFDWAVINFRRAEGRWSQGLLVSRADCPSCAQEQ